MLNNLTVFASKKTKGYKHDIKNWLKLPVQEEDLPNVTCTGGRFT